MLLFVFILLLLDFGSSLFFLFFCVFYFFNKILYSLCCWTHKSNGDAWKSYSFNSMSQDLCLLVCPKVLLLLGGQHSASKSKQVAMWQTCHWSSDKFQTTDIPSKPRNPHQALESWSCSENVLRGWLPEKAEQFKHTWSHLLSQRFPSKTMLRESCGCGIRPVSPNFCVAVKGPDSFILSVRVGQYGQCASCTKWHSVTAKFQGRGSSWAKRSLCKACRWEAKLPHLHDLKHLKLQTKPA